MILIPQISFESVTLILIYDSKQVWGQPVQISKLAMMLLGLISLAALSACGDDLNSQNSPANTPAPPPPSPSTTKIFTADQAGSEGDATANGSIVFTVYLNAASSQQVTVDYRTEDNTATAGDDYTAASGTLVFDAGVTEQTVTVELLGDANDETAEELQFILENPMNASVEIAQVTGVIANDDLTCNPRNPNSPNPWLAAERTRINFAHRGGRFFTPENTIYGFHQALAIGADVLEIDVYESSDGVLMAIHDATVDRTTNGSGNISMMTLADLKALDAAFWFVQDEGTPQDRDVSEYTLRGIATSDQLPPEGFRPNDFTIPTVEEVLQTFPNTLINIEIKTGDDSGGNYAARLAALVLSYGRTDTVMVASFSDDASGQFKTAAPCVSTSYPTGQAAAAIASGQGPSPITANPTHDAFQVPRGQNGIEIVTQDFVDDAHDANQAVHVFTINDCEEMIELLDLGVDAVMTDRPEILEQLLQQTPGQLSCDGI